MKNKLTVFLLFSLIIGYTPTIAHAEDINSNRNIEIKEVEKTDNHVLLSIDSEEDIKRVRTPDGNWVNQESFNYKVTKNGSYDFVYETIDGKTDVISKDISDLRATYLITNKDDVVLKLVAEDLLSGMGSMKFKNETNGTWTAYEPYAQTRNWRLDTTEGLKTVFVTYKDIAGNETTEIFDKIILDKSGPTISNFTINNNDAYTKTRNVTLNITAVDNYSNVSKLMISNDNSNWTEVNYSTSVPWTLTANSGMKTVYVKAVDSLGNVGNVKTDTIYFDEVLPTGSISINNGATITNSRNVKLKINFADAHSGVKRLTIIEKDKIYNLPNVPSSSPTEIDWTLSHGATGQVTLEVEDKAGNIYRTNSNVITIATLEVTKFRLTNVVNPSNYNDTNPFKPIEWTFPAQDMKAGANISFDINYNLDLDNKTTSVVTGDYYVEIVNDNGYHKIIQANFNNKITNGFEATITLPSDAPTDSKVYISSKITAKLTNEKETFTNEAFFPAKSEKALIGIIKGNIKEDINFNEIT